MNRRVCVVNERHYSCSGVACESGLRANIYTAWHLEVISPPCREHSAFVWVRCITFTSHLTPPPHSDTFILMLVGSRSRLNAYYTLLRNTTYGQSLVAAWWQLLSAAPASLREPGLVSAGSPGRVEASNPSVTPSVASGGRVRPVEEF